MRIIYLILGMGLLSGFFSPSARAVDWDWEQRCCLTAHQLEKVFLITLSPVGPPIGHLQVTTPNGVRVGMNEATGYFYPPAEAGREGGIYALGPHPDLPVSSPGFNHSRPRYLIIHTHWLSPRAGPVYRAMDVIATKAPPRETDRRLHAGQYQVRVIGRFKGAYRLRFNPVGHGETRAAVVFEGDRKQGVAIKPGQVHIYVFDGAFDNAYGVPNSTQGDRPFKVRRLK